MRVDPLDLMQSLLMAHAGHRNDCGTPRLGSYRTSSLVSRERDRTVGLASFLSRWRQSLRTKECGCMPGGWRLSGAHLLEVEVANRESRNRKQSGVPGSRSLSSRSLAASDAHADIFTRGQSRVQRWMPVASSVWWCALLRPPPQPRKPCQCSPSHPHQAEDVRTLLWTSLRALVSAEIQVKISS